MVNGNMFISINLEKRDVRWPRNERHPSTLFRPRILRFLMHLEVLPLDIHTIGKSTTVEIDPRIVSIEIIATYLFAISNRR
jgi:hypothetical protein